MWFIICSSIDCLPTDLLISGKTSDQSNQTSIIESSNGNIDNEKLTLNSIDPKTIDDSQKVHKRVKRVHVFRPLFVYRQEKIERQRIIEQRKLQNRRVDKVKEHKNQCCKCNRN